MDFKTAISIIEKEYSFRWVNKGCIQIETTQLLDPFNCCMLALFDKNGVALLTDFADNMQVITLPEKRVQEICKQHNIIYNNYHLECIFKSNDDIKRYFECLQQITDEM